jgi:thioredoxin-related protein
MIQKASILLTCFIAILLFLSTPLSAQKAESIRWLSFEALEDSLAIQPKKVFIDFYTDWCAYCRKMDKVVFAQPEVIDLLNTHFYAVRFNAETDSAITFGGQVLINDQIGASRTPVHQIAQLLALRNGRFTAPTLILLDEEFRVTARYFEYMGSEKLVKALK